ncbi:unnamed protein product, partial [marine sediment metagenome]
DGIIDREIEPDEIICEEVPYPPAKPSGPTMGDTDVTYTYSTSTTDPEGDQIYYWFNWGDGTDSGWIGPYDSGESVSAFHSWDTQSIFKVKTKAKDVLDHVSDWSDDLPVYIVYIDDILPVANANGPYEGIVGIPVGFHGSASSGTPPYSYYWNFGDGVYSSAQNPRHTYDEEGDYTVSLRVTDDNDMSATDVARVVIHLSEAVVADAGGPYSGDIGETIQFSGSAIGGTEPYSWYWEFGDGSISTIQ